MRNRAVSELNRKIRLEQAAIAAMRAENPDRAIRELHQSWDWLHATRVTRALVDRLLDNGANGKYPVEDAVRLANKVVKKDKDQRLKQGVQFDQFAV